MNDAICLRATAVRTDQALRIDYECKNQGSAAAYVYAHVLRGGSSHGAYTVLHRPEDELVLFLGPPPVPPGFTGTAKVLPKAYLLKPGATFADYLEIPVPVREWQPYGNADYPRDCPVVAAKKVVLATETILDKDVFFARPTGDNPPLFRVDGYPVRRVEVDVPIASPVPVLYRMGPFFRF
jgi:hypothetical protein